MPQYCKHCRKAYHRGWTGCPACGADVTKYGDGFKPRPDRTDPLAPVMPPVSGGEIVPGPGTEFEQGDDITVTYPEDGPDSVAPKSDDE